MNTPVATNRPPILLIEDTPSLMLLYRSVLTNAGLAVVTATTAADGLNAFHSSGAKLVLLDMVLPDQNGLDLMQDLLRLRPDTQVIVMTAHGSINMAVDAMRAGAHEFLVKPFDEVKLLHAVANAGGIVTPRRSAAKGTVAAAQISLHSSAFIGSSDAMARVHAKIASVSRSMATVFITGESGTGKELCALAVHGNSARAAGPFIALNCGAIPQDLLESEVFGHMKGSFTGAISDKQGAAAAADGGTLFLDEICEMAPLLQTKLLRFLQTTTVVPVGATRPRKVNVRIICATNRDPLEAVRRGQFREDLFYRLFVVPIHMPALRERGDDIVEIAETALTRFAMEEGKPFNGLHPDVLSLFRSMDWPGNVRQLLNVIRNIVVLHEGGQVATAMLPDTLHQSLGIAPVSAAVQTKVAAVELDLDAVLGRPLAEVERLVIEATLARFNGSVPKAARVLDLSPSTLYRKIEAWAKS